MSEDAIKVVNLDKSFDEVHAVNDVSFSIQQGEIFSLLGPNGAGKTTTIGIITGLLSPDSGEVWLMGLFRPGSAQKSQGRIRGGTPGNRPV